MPLPEGLLSPIPGDNPSGQDLRYDPVYDKIREARRAEEEIQLSDENARGDVWARAVKKADYIQVTKLATEALSKRSKDLQIAAWLTEALLVQERIPGLTQGIKLMHGLLETFWDTVYPVIEDDDAGMRAAPLEWVGSSLDIQIRRTPLTKTKLDWFKFQESRRVPYENDAKDNESKRIAREAAIAEKKCTPEEFDDGVKGSGDTFYKQLTAEFGSANEAVLALETLSDEKFGRDAPNFAVLKKALEDLQDAVREYWKPPAELEESPQEEGPAEEGAAEEAVSTTSTATPSARKARTAQTEEPTDPEDAMRRVVGLARYLRTANPASPVSYLLLRSLRWGELRANGYSLDPNLLEAPPSETRQHLKKLSNDGDWNGLLEAAEMAMAQPYGRAWLDVQRHTVRACENLGYDAAAGAMRRELNSLLTDFPDLISTSLSDDTPAANSETLTWIKECIVPPAATIESPAETPIIAVATPAVHNGDGKPDVAEVAQQAANSGRIQDAVELLTREISQERSGRGRFQRKVQLAAVCLSVKREDVAYPILAELAEEIDRRKLEEWEESSSLARPLALLLRCLEKLGHDDAVKRKIYEKVCRLDPVQVLTGMR
jgi:type VI secretion system protein ImpA